MWIDIVIGALFGALGALIAPPILKRLNVPEDKRKTAHSIAVIIFVFLGLQIVAPIAREEYALHQLNETLLTTPVYIALKKYEPQTYSQVADTLRAGFKAGKSSSQTEADGRAIVGALVEKRLTVAGDAVVIDYMKVTLKELQKLHAGGDDACYVLMHPDAGPPFNMKNRVSKETSEADRRLLAAVLESAATAPQPRVNLKDFEQQLFQAVTPLQSKYGANLSKLDAPQAGTKSRREVCEMVMDLYAEIFKLPPGQASKLLRALLSA